MSEKSKNTGKIDYDVINQLVNDNEDLTEKEILKLYKKLQEDQETYTVDLLTGNITDKADVLLESALNKTAPENTQSKAQYIIEKRLASGGQSDVYLAHRKDKTFSKAVAVKVMNSAILDEDQASQLLNEIQILAGLNHPNIVSILDAGFDQKKHPWMVLNYVDGLHLDQYIAIKKLSEKQILLLLADVANAIKYIHDKEIQHLDIKPANILVEEIDNKPIPVIIDFGISLNTLEDSEPKNNYATLAYASPEQLDTKSNTDHRSDIYSLGQLIENLIYANQSNDKRQPDIQAIIRRCTEPDPKNRYQSTTSLLSDIQSYINGDPVSARPLSMTQRWTKQYIKRPWINSLILALVVSILVLTTYFIHKKHQQEKMAAQQVIKNQYYWDRADKIERSSELIYARPNGNIEKDLSQIKQEYEHLKNQLQSESLELQKSASFALASAATSIGEFEQAQPFLTLANKNSPENTEVSYALANNHLQLYQIKTQELKNFSNREFRSTHKKRLQQEHLKPAKILLERIESNDDAMINGMLLFLNEDSETALNLLTETENEGVWPIQQWLLTAQIHQQQASNFMTLGETEPTIEQLESAIHYLKKAQSYARSHPQIQTMLCQTQADLLINKNSKAETTILPDCQALLNLLPNSNHVTLTVANTYALIARNLRKAGVNPNNFLIQAENLLNHDYNSTPKDIAEQQLILGLINYIKGEWHFNTTQKTEGSSFLNQSIKNLEYATENLPNSYLAKLRLAESLFYMANSNYESDPETEKTYQQAIDLMLELQNHADATITLSTNLVKIIADLAYRKFQVGQAAEEQFVLANQVYDQLKTKHPDNGFVISAGRHLNWTHADYLVYQNSNPEPYLSEALLLFDQEIKLRPTSVGRRYNKISAMLLGINYFLNQKKDQSIELKATLQALTDLQQSVDESYDLSAHLGFYHNMMAMQLIQAEQSPQVTLIKAETYNRECLTSKLDAYACQTQWATYVEIKHQWQYKNQQFNKKQWHADTAIIEQGLEKYPKHHQLQAHYGRLKLMATDFIPMDQAHQKTTLTQAKDLLQQALTGNALLAGRFQPDLTIIENRLADLTTE